MTEDIFREGGPHDFRRLDPDRIQATIKLPADEEGFVGRCCPDEACSPGYFKVASDVDAAVCPYCAKRAAANDFHTKEQHRYAKEIILGEASAGISRMIAKGLGLPAAGGRRKLGGDFLSIELSFRPDPPTPVRRPEEEELRRDLVCRDCSARHAVFGLATWCPSCGRDVFVQHVAAELDVLRKQIADVADRRARLGARVAAQDLENVLEDAVSIFEGVLKVIVRRGLLRSGKSDVEVEAVFKKDVRNTFQSVSRGRVLVRELLGLDLYATVSENDIERQRVIFEMRHPVTHNLGVVDRKYLDQVRSGEREGREVRVSVDDVTWVLDHTEKVLALFYAAVLGGVSATDANSKES